MDYPVYGQSHLRYPNVCLYLHGPELSTMRLQYPDYGYVRLKLDTEKGEKECNR